MNRRRAWAALLPLGLGAACSWTGAFATYSSSVAVSVSAASGSVDLRANGSQGPTYTWAGLTVSGMLPTDVTYALLTLTDNGTVAVTWSMSTSTTGTSALATALTAGVRQVPSASCTSTTYAGGTVLSADASGLTSAAISGQPLAASGTTYLCFMLSLPSGASTALQGASVTPSFTFTATS